MTARTQSLGLATILALACSAHASEVSSLRIVPREMRLSGTRASQRFVVLATGTDGLERDVTDASSRRVSDLHVVRIEDGSRLLALQDGQAVLRAEFAGRVAAARVRIEQSDSQRPLSFPRDIVGILTKRGCNGSECHGGVKGRGGLKLSMNGRNPREDYRWIVEGGVYQVLTTAVGEPIEPRVDVDDPTKSLFLLKPTGAVDHGGGKRLSVDSTDYMRLVEWIRDGARLEEDPQRAIRDLEVFPGAAVLELNGARRLLVTARLASGESEDLSDKVRYESSNPEVLDVSADGVIKAVKTGEAVVFVYAAGRTLGTRFGVVDAPLSVPEFPLRNLIDKHVLAKLRRFRIVPSGLSSDHEFLRRVCLDLTGTLPPPDGVREFLRSTDSRKRDKLIEVLLQSPEYVDYWTFRFADFFRVTYRDAGSYRPWIRECIAHNKPYDQMAREHLAAQGRSGPTRHYFKANGGLLLPKEKMSEDARLFLGVRLDCAECHDHPFEAWTQNQFWGLAAFYGRTTRERQFGVFFEDQGGMGENPEGPRVMHPRLGREVEPAFPDGRPLPESERSSPRTQFAEWVTASGNPFFARAIVNRIWSFFFSRGLVEPVDDFKDSNPPTHPELLEALARDFEQNGYDLKRMMRRITRSRTYQLSGDPNESNENDRINCSRALPRKLDAEVLLDAITRVTDVEQTFELHDYVRGGVEPRGTRAIELIAEVSPSQFLDVFGRPPFREAVPVRDRSATLAQALHMLVGQAYNEKIGKVGGRVDRLLKSGASVGEVIEEFYLAALCRFPGEEERADLQELIERAPSRKKVLENLVWALIASREFLYNH